MIPEKLSGKWVDDPDILRPYEQYVNKGCGDETLYGLKTLLARKSDSELERLKWNISSLMINYNNANSLSLSCVVFTLMAVTISLLSMIASILNVFSDASNWFNLSISTVLCVMMIAIAYAAIVQIRDFHVNNNLMRYLTLIEGLVLEETESRRGRK